MGDGGSSCYGYEGRSVAFIDILGFSELVDRSLERSFFPSLLGALRTVKRFGQSWPTFMAQQGIPPEETQAVIDFRSYTFSDCIVLSERGAMVAPLMVAVSRLTMALLQVDILVRGGIAIGKLHHDDAVVFGPALIEAYQLERTCAKYPRVLLSDRALAVAGENLIKFGGSALSHRANSFARQDADGLHYVDFLRMAAAAPESVVDVPKGKLSTYIICALRRTEKEYGNTVHPLDIRSKFGWLARYIKTFLSEHPDIDVTIR